MPQRTDKGWDQFTGDAAEASMATGPVMMAYVARAIRAELIAEIKAWHEDMAVTMDLAGRRDAGFVIRQLGECVDEAFKP